MLTVRGAVRVDEGGKACDAGTFVCVMMCYWSQCLLHVVHQLDLKAFSSYIVHLI